MEEFEKKHIKKQKNSTILQSLYELIEQPYVDSIFLKFLGVSLYFFHMTSYAYYFSINKITDSYAQYICCFHYYLNLANILHYIKSSIFTILYFVFSENYINDYFKPIQISMHDFSLQYHFNGGMMISNIKNEYFQLNMINVTERPEYGLFINLIYNQSINQVKRINDRFRNNVLDLKFNTFYRKNLINFYEGFDFKLKKVRYIEFIDKMLNNMNNNLPILTSFNEKPILDFNGFLFLIRNFPTFLKECASLYNELIDEFAASDKQINTIFFNLLLIFILLCMFIKIYEGFQWYLFLNLLRDLLKMYLRISEDKDELTCEINKLKDFVELMKDSNEKYMNHDAIEDSKIKNIKLKQNSNKDYKNFKNGRRALYFRSQGLPKKLLFFYFYFCSSIIVLYFIFSYYNWMTVDKYIVRLTNTNTLFLSTYVYSSSIAFLEDLLYREKIIRNPEFEKINDSMQTKNGRIAFIKTALNKRMNVIANTSMMNIVLDGIDGRQKSSQMNHLLTGNLCELIAI